MGLKHIFYAVFGLYSKFKYVNEANNYILNKFVYK